MKQIKAFVVTQEEPNEGGRPIAVFADEKMANELAEKRKAEDVAEDGYAFGRYEVYEFEMEVNQNDAC